MAGIILAFSIMLQNSIQNAQHIDVDKIVIEESFTKQETAKLDEDVFEYLCKCVESEAGDHDFLGKCYVTDVILNRVDHKDFPNSIVEVINQHRIRSDGTEEWQFEVVKNGRINSIEVTDETRRAVQEELNNRKNNEILFFCMYDWFSGWAKWLFQYPETGNNVHHFYKEK